MAGGGAGLAEFARLSPPKKAFVFALIGALLGVLYWKIAYVALDEDLEAVQAEHKGKLATNKRLGDDLTSYEDLQARMAKQREQIERSQTALPNEAEIPAFLETLQRKVAESGVEIRKWSNRGQEPVESFVRVPVDVEMAGTFMQIKRFFASLSQKDIRPSPTPNDRVSEERERIVSIENLALGSPTVKNREIILTARFTAVLFRQGDNPAAQPGTGQPGAGGAKPPAARPAGTPGAAPASSPASSPPPLPSAATPAGARAAVEQALDKGDARNRNAGGADEAKPPATGSDRLRGGL